MTPNIIMTDYVVGDPLKELYSNCGLFVLPSHTEGLSLSFAGGTVHRRTVSGERYPREYGRDRHLRRGLQTGGYG